MSSQIFSLLPFPFPGVPHDIKISGSVGRCDNMLRATFILSGHLDDVVIPPPSAPVRRDGLWEETCFEFFLALSESAPYWEFNLSPAGHWNVYRFTSYRTDMEREQAFTSLPFAVRAGQDVMNLSVTVDIGGIVPARNALQVGITSVIKKKDGARTYWALSHPGPRPDFHHRENFVIEL